MTDENTIAQLIDETKPTIDALRRNIVVARRLSLHIDRPADRFDLALSALSQLEAEMKELVQEELAREEEG